MSEYPKFKSIPRLHRDVVITEKVDGTNGLISIQPFPEVIGSGTEEDWQSPMVADHVVWIRDEVGQGFVIKAGSRNRWLALDNDNMGFCRWVFENAFTLFHDLGEGMHYGEWYGSGIQRGYGLTKGEKRFALFNTKRWDPEKTSLVTPNLRVVPVLEVVEGGHHLYDVEQNWLSKLEHQGSVIEPGFMRPEGIVLYHTAANQYFKATIEDDETGKKE